MKRKIEFLQLIQFNIRPLFRSLERVKNIDAHIFYASNHGIKPKMDEDFNKKFAWNIDLISGYKYKFIGSNKHNVNNFLLNSNTIKKEIKKKRFDANIIFGWNNLYYLKSIFYSFFYSKKLILRAENNHLKKENNFKKFLKKFFFFYFLNFLITFYTLESKIMNFIVKMECQKKLISAPYFVDNNFLIKIIKNLILKLRKIVFIFSGKL